MKAEYNSKIGGLQYLSNNTRPDIVHAINYLALFLTNPSEELYQASRRVLRNISKDPDRGVTFTTSSMEPTLETYSDADFAGDPNTVRTRYNDIIPCHYFVSL